MREIEIKAKVADRIALIEALARQGVKLSAPIKQHDVVYGRPGITDNEAGSVWLRIRTEDDAKHIFTLKQQVRGGLDSLEHETEIIDAEEMASIVKLLGFTLYSDLTKTRQKAKIDDIEICVDEVEELGSFIEAEKLSTEDADGDAIAEELWGLLEKFGVARSSEVFDGYDVLMNRQKKAGHGQA